MKKRICILILLNIFNLALYAQESKKHPIDISFDNCDKETTYKWGECIKEHQLLWEEELEINYQKLNSVYTGERLKLFELSQVNWKAYYLIKKKFLFGDIEVIKRMGSLPYMELCESLMFDTRERALELEFWYKNLPK